MKADTRKALNDTMLSVVLDARSSRIERIEAAKVLLSLAGMFIPDVNESFLSARQITNLRQLKQAVIERALNSKERKRKANRRSYLRKKLAAVEGQEPQQPQQEPTAEQNAADLFRKAQGENNGEVSR